MRRLGAEQAGVSVVEASLSRILSPDENAIGLYVNTDPSGMLKQEDILGRLQRGPDNTLLLDITPTPKYPDYDAAQGLVLVRDDGTIPEARTEQSRKID